MEKKWKAVDNGWALSSVIWDQETDIVTETWRKIEKSKGKKTEKSQPSCPAPSRLLPTKKTTT